MAINKSQVDHARTALRLPREMHKQVHEQAKKEDRTFNGQIVAMLREGLHRREIEASHAN